MLERDYTAERRPLARVPANVREVRLSDQRQRVSELLRSGRHAQAERREREFDPEAPLSPAEYWFLRIRALCALAPHMEAREHQWLCSLIWRCRCGYAPRRPQVAQIQKIERRYT